jgi:hypothetical protein
MLKNGQFPSCIDFKCVPINAGGDLDYMTERASIAACCKKDLTLLYVDHMKYIWVQRCKKRDELTSAATGRNSG